MLPASTLAELEKELNQKAWTPLFYLGDEFVKKGQEIVPFLLAVYPRIRSWKGRKVIMWALPQIKPIRQEVVELAMSACFDKAYAVRDDAIDLLAKSLSRDALPVLLKLKADPDKRISFAARCAI